MTRQNSALKDERPTTPSRIWISIPLSPSPEPRYLTAFLQKSELHPIGTTATVRTNLASFPCSNVVYAGGVIAVSLVLPSLRWLEVSPLYLRYGNHCRGNFVYTLHCLPPQYYRLRPQQHLKTAF